MSKDLIFTFLEAKSVDIDASENTIKSYSQDLDKYIDWLAPSKIQILDVQLQHIEQYLVHLKNRGLSIASRARHLSSINNFIDLLLRKDGHRLIQRFRSRAQVDQKASSVSNFRDNRATFRSGRKRSKKQKFEGSKYLLDDTPICYWNACFRNDVTSTRRCKRQSQHGFSLR